MATAEAIWKAWEGLSGPEKDILEVLAVHYEPINQTELASGLRQLKVGAAGLIGKPWRDKMLRLHLLETAGNQLRCQHLLAGRLAFQALKKGTYARFFELGVHQFDDRWGRENHFYYHPSRFKRNLRHALLQGDVKTFTELMTIPDPYATPAADRSSAMIEVCMPLVHDWFDVMPSAFKFQLLRFSLEMQNYQLRDTGGLYQLLQDCMANDADRRSPLRVLLAEQELYRMNWDGFDTAIADDASPRSVALRAAKEFILGENSRSLTTFAAALAAQKKVTKKRNLFIPDMPGLMYCLALVKEGSPASTALLKRQTAAAMRKDADEKLVYCFDLLHRFREVWDGKVLQAELLATLPMLGPRHTYATVAHIWGLVLYWLDQPAPRELIPALEEVGRRAKAAPMPWQAQDIGSLLAAFAGKQANGLAAMMPKLAPWERALQALAALSPAERAGKAEKTATENRLVWMLRRDFGSVTIEPREQKRLKNGGWTKGRAVSLTRLVESRDKITFLTPADALICGRIKPNPYGYSGYHLPVGKALAAAAGHPCVFWEDDLTRPVEVTQRQPELIVKESADHVSISMYPGLDLDDDEDEMDSVDDFGSEVLVERPGAIDVFSFTAQHQRIADIIDGELKVPVSAKARVVQSIMAISPLLMVHSDLPGIDMGSVETVVADATLAINVLPGSDSLKFDVAVQPFGTGPRFLPGAGGESVFAELDGRRVQTRRDLDAEKQSLDELLACCSGLVAQRPGVWAFSDLAQALEGLLSMQQLEHPPVLAWPEGKQIRLHPEAGVGSASLSIRSHTNWFEVDGELRIGETDVVDMQKLMMLMDASTGRFVQLGDNEFVALTEELRKRLDRLRAIAANGRIHALAGIHLDDATEGMTLDADKPWQAFKARLQAAREFVPVLPSTLDVNLRDYQHDGYRWLARLAEWGAGACLADDMGLGKTVQSLALILSRAPLGPTLVLAPTSVCMNWIDEAQRFAPTLHPQLFGAGDRETVLSALGPFDLLVVSYGLLASETERLTEVSWCTVVADEAQAFKNANTLRSKAVMKLDAPFRMITTGTPIENHLGELWNLFNFINPGLMGSLDQFNNQFARPIENGDAEARTRLKNLIQPFVLRRLKSDVLAELPPRTDIVLTVELSKEESALYEALRREAKSSLEAVESDNQQRMIALAHITRLRQAVCNPALVMPDAGIPSSKLAMFGTVVDELLENHHKVLVFSQFVRHLALVRAFLDERKIRYQYLDGSMNPGERRTAVTAFQAGEADVFLISLRAGGMGLNLTAANYVIHLDPWWNPAVEDQASDRAHRLGQQRPVTVYRLVAANTIEQKIVELHQRKRDLADSLLEGADIGGRMTFDDMLALIG